MDNSHPLFRRNCSPSAPVLVPSVLPDTTRTGGQIPTAVQCIPLPLIEEVLLSGRGQLPRVPPRSLFRQDRLPGLMDRSRSRLFPRWHCSPPLIQVFRPRDLNTKRCTGHLPGKASPRHPSAAVMNTPGHKENVCLLPVSRTFDVF